MRQIWRDIGIVLLILLVLAAAWVGIGYMRGTVHFGHGGSASAKLVEGKYTPKDSASLVIDADVADITLQPGDAWAVEYALEKEPEITEENGILTFRDQSKNHVNIGIHNTPEQHITITVPAEIALELEVDVGDVRIGNLAFTDLSVETDVGDVKMENVISSGSLDVECDVGNVTMSEVNGGSVTAASDVGDLNVNLTGPLTDYALMVDADVGDIVVDGLKQGKFYNTEGGIPVFIKTDTGDINVSFGS